jgi:predicted transcriptional regulator
MTPGCSNMLQECQARFRELENKFERQSYEAQSDISQLECHFIDLKDRFKEVDTKVNKLEVGMVLLQEGQKQTAGSISELKDDQKYNRRWVMATMATGLMTLAGIVVSLLK